MKTIAIKLPDSLLAAIENAARKSGGVREEQAPFLGRERLHSDPERM